MKTRIIELSCVDDCAILLLAEDVRSNFSTIAYVVPNSQTEIEALESKLKEQLPSSLIPDIIVSILSLPTNASGQLNIEGLKKIPAIDRHVIDQWKQQILETTKAQQVVISREPSSQESFFTTELLPGLFNSVQAPTIPVSKTNQCSSSYSKPAIIVAEALTKPKDYPHTLIDILHRAALSGTSRGIRYVESNGRESFQSYHQLLHDAQLILGGIQQHKLQKGSPIGLQFAQNRDFISTFWACLLGGYIPVPMAPVRTSKLDDNASQRLTGACHHLAPLTIITGADTFANVSIIVEHSDSGNTSTKILSLESLHVSNYNSNCHQGEPSDIALLAMTSGSTGAPKFVMLNHQNILSQAFGSAHLNDFTEFDVSLNWMPLDHVGGIIFFHLRDLFLKANQIHVATSVILEDPIEWLTLLEKHRVTLTWAPNFAFGLVNDQLDNLKNHTLDLSSIKCILNGAEPIVTRTARKFLQLLEPHGLHSSTIRPAFGMAEISSGVIYSDRFSLSNTSDNDKFVDLGCPIPGVSVRVVNEDDQLCVEGEQGHLQIAGNTVMQGYYNLPEITKQSFTKDGWLKTADLAVIKDGRLTVVGREEGVIIVNGLNYYAHEIEALVEQLPSIEPSYTAAVPISSFDGDQLAIFFCIRKGHELIMAQIISEIQSTVSCQIGLHPSFILPVAPNDIPKTSLGKIQHKILRKRFQAGDFHKHQILLDKPASINRNLPAWFHEKVWVRNELRTKYNPHAQHIVLFADNLGLAQMLESQLADQGHTITIIGQSNRYEEQGSTKIVINPTVPEHYIKALGTSSKQSGPIGQLVHLWSYDNSTGKFENLEALRKSQIKGCVSLIYLTKALHTIGNTQQMVDLTIVTNNANALYPDEIIAYEKSSITSLCTTITKENPWLRSRSIDLSGSLLESDCNTVMLELNTIPVEQFIAYRDNMRFVRRLKRANPVDNSKSALPIQQEGLYLISGGMGGVGFELAKLLLTKFTTKLILIGTSPANLHSKQLTYLDSIKEPDTRIAYSQADVCDMEALRDTVSHYEKRWSTTLAGVIHLAGEFHENQIIEETPEQILGTFHSKVFGAWTLHQLIKERLEGLFVSISSVTGLLGGIASGAYSAANAILDSFSENLRHFGYKNSYTISFSRWADTGMSRGYNAPPSPSFYAISAAQGTSSFLVALKQNKPLIFVGLNDSSREIAKISIDQGPSLSLPTAYVQANTTAVPASSMLIDRLGNHFQCPIIASEQLTEDTQLKFISDIPSSDSIIYPRTKLEKHIARIWSEVLKQKSIGVNQEFFALGGNSLLAAQISARLKKEFNTSITLMDLLESGNVEKLAKRIESSLVTGQEIGSTHSTEIEMDSNNRFKPFPLTYIQHAYWIGRSSVYELGNVATHIYLELQLDSIDLERLTSALNKLIQQHDMLRTIILPNGTQQVLKTVPDYNIAIHDLRNVPTHIIRSHLRSQKQRLSHQIVPEDQWPLFAIEASVLNNRLTRLHISMDALIADSWSMLTLMDQWWRLYSQPHACLDIPAITFRDYVLAIEGSKGTDEFNRSERYWKERLKSLPNGPDLPLTRSPSSIKKPRFNRRFKRISKDTWDKLKKLSANYALTPSALLLAAFTEVLAYWSTTPHFSINLTLFNRFPFHPDVNKLVGDFTSLSFIEVNRSSATSFIQHAIELQNQIWRNLDYRHVSGIQILREMNRNRAYSTVATMPIVFTSGLSFDSLGLDTAVLRKFGKVAFCITQTPQVWLDHQVFEDNGELLIGWDAVEELFPCGLLDDMFKAYCSLISKLAVDDNSWKCNLFPNLLPNRNRQHNLPRSTSSEHASSDLLHFGFLENAHKSPSHIAILSSNKSLTYGELAQQVIGFSNEILRGSRTNGLIGICMYKGWEQVVATLSASLSGRAYVPIDPDLPKQRLEQLLLSAGITLMLVTDETRKLLEWYHPAELITVGNKYSYCEFLLQPNVVQPEDLAYVIYTSGSTGAPKGVMIDHRGALNTIRDINQRFNIGPADRVLALSSLSFDLSVYDIFGTLTAGATICIPDSKLDKDPEHWLNLINQYAVTIWNSVPALMQAFVDHINVKRQSPENTLRLVMLSGDWIPIALPIEIRKLWPTSRVISLGGATEVSIWSILFEIDKVDPSWKSIPYGKPLTNQQVYVLNEQNLPSPTWVPGHIYIGGIGLAIGYWNDQAQTEERFILHPQTGERLFKTGDLGRFLPDGNIEFLGRNDFQVKVNGFRIELEEIARTLESHEDVAQAVVIAEGKNGSAKSLRAFVVLSKNKSEFDDNIAQIKFKLEQNKQVITNNNSVIMLRKPQITPQLQQEYLNRQSHRDFLPEEIELDQFSRFLSSAMPINLGDAPLLKFRYPSAGSLYPIHIYVCVKPNAINGLSAGAYFYDRERHQLIPVTYKDGQDCFFGHNRNLFSKAAFALFFIGNLSEIEPIYSASSKDFCLLEAGYLGQLLAQEAPKHHIGLCPIGYLNDMEVHSVFDLDHNQIVIHSMLGGLVSNVQTTRWDSLQPRPIGEILKEYLAQRLPQYMVPSTVQLIDKIPLTSNGKIDREALLSISVKLDSKHIELPNNNTERTIASIVQEVLNLDRVGIHDNFFEIGASSISLIQIRARLEAAFSAKLDIVSLFSNPTIAALARHMDPKTYPSPIATNKFSPSQRAAKQQEQLKQQRKKHLADNG